jgi:CheY-like chemotaxis protein
LERGRKKDLAQQGGVEVEAKRLDGKKVLIVDDEPDVLETLAQLLPMCDLRKASSFDEARELLEKEEFDIAILDIMGVNGYKLLEIAKKRNVIAVMLTAHALSIEDTVRSYKKGAASYVPKDEMANIKAFLDDILEAKEKGKSFWWRWMDRLGSYYDNKFGPGWREDDKEFWEKFPTWL